MQGSLASDKDDGSLTPNGGEWAWTLSLQAPAEAEGDAIARERGLAGKHVWDFKPKYEAEAFVRYRIKPRTRTDADVEEVR